MEAFSEQWFREALANIRADDQMSQIYRHIHSSFQFQIGHSLLTFYAFNHAIQDVTSERVVHPVDFCLIGETEVWQMLLDGEIGFTKGLSPLYRKFSISGSPVKFQQNLFFLVHLFKHLRAIAA